MTAAMTLDEFLSRLKGVRRCGSGWKALCPAHDDKNPSLHISQGGDGQILLHCFAGCAVEDICKALGIDVKNLFPDSTDKPQAWNCEKPEAIYKYLDENGKLLFQVLRFPKRGGKKVFKQRRPDGKGGWIWNLDGVRKVLYRLPEVLEAVNRGETIFVVEGEKDADNLAKLGLVATTNPGGARKWRPEFSEYLKGANCVILSDNDEVGREHVQQVARSLHGKAASVKVLEFPGLPEKGDVSDWLAAGGTKEKLLRLVAEAPEWRPPEQEPDPLAGTPYLIHNGCICGKKYTRDGDAIITPLCNFTAKIVRDVARDDGAEETRVFEIEGSLSTGAPLPRIKVPAEKFFGMSWVANWGVNAIIGAGMGVKDRVREAIQLLSRDAVKEHVFTHLGWRKINGRWCYLHANGAVGAENVLVAPESEALRRYSLPDSGDPAEGMKASLKLLEIGPPEVVLPLWCAVWRAPLNSLLYPTVVLWLYGMTGSFKSTLAALFLSHFGGPFSKDSLPASWLATDNALERLCFLARDTVLVIDDYAPEQHPREAAALDKRVNRLVRQVGNRAARSRLQGDLTARPETPPNALVISTGEQLPLGIASVAARILPVLCEREKIDTTKLSEAQAKAQLLPQAMYGYLSWLAPQLDTLAKTLPQRFEELRSRATIEGHARLPEAVAHLYLGAEFGLRYAVELGVLSTNEAEEIAQKTWSVLIALAREHAKTLEEERPTLRFLHTLDAIFTQGKGHLLDRQTGGRPILAYRFGWTPVETGNGEADYQKNGELLGWADSDGLYLIPEAVWRAVNEYLRSSGGFPVRERTLRDMLAREGVLIRDEKTGKNTTVIRAEGTSRRVLHLNLNMYLSLLQRGVIGVTEAEKPDKSSTPALPLKCNSEQKSVTESVTGTEAETETEALHLASPLVTLSGSKSVTPECQKNQASRDFVTPVTPSAKEGEYISDSDDSPPDFDGELETFTV
ncbi:MAG: DUF927 domain-containing protein [Thermacetogeniaceae bacterium]